jgi:hypothetical protein
MLNETYSKKSQNQNLTKSQNSTESPELCQISRTRDVLKGPFLQKKIKKERYRTRIPLYEDNVTTFQLTNNNFLFFF